MPCIQQTEGQAALRALCLQTPVPCPEVHRAPILEHMGRLALVQRVEVLQVNHRIIQASHLETLPIWALVWVLDHLVCKKVTQDFGLLCNSDSALETLSQWQEAWADQEALGALEDQVGLEDLEGLEDLGDLEALEGLQGNQGCKVIQA